MTSNRQNRKNLYGLPGNFSFLSQITDRTPEQFLEDLMKIHENQYTPIKNIPSILGRKINLLALYNAVAKRGGFKKMNTEWSWEGVLTDLKMPIKCANASVALRSIFQRYLEPFERLQRNKATINDIEDELQMESDNRYKTMAQRTTLTHCTFNATSMVYRADVHQIPSHKRQESGLSCDLSDAVEFQKLEMSLKSGLVNEIEFSLNTVLLMSFQTDGVHLCRNHRLLDLILSTIGIGNFDLLKDLSDHDTSTRRFLQFWNDIVVCEEGRRFLLPDIFTMDEYEAPKLETLDYMFQLYDGMTVYDKEGQRIQLVVTIIRNLALDSLNGRILTQSHQCMRLIILCCYASHFALRQLGLEIMSMLSFPVVGILCETLKDFLMSLMNSEDRVDRLRGLEILSHLSDQRVCIDNSEFLSGLPKHLFASLISMLIIHDLHIVVLALESVYALSEVDSYLCTKLVECSSETLSTLFVLLSLEAQVMGTQSLIRIRVMQGPAMVTTCPPTNQTTLHRATIQQPQTNQKQLATSLMPPPPVPTHKIPAIPISIPNVNSSRSQISMATESPGSQNKAQIIQKIYPVITRNNLVMPTVQSNGISQTAVPSIVKSELITTSSVPMITSEVVAPATFNTKSCINGQVPVKQVPPIASISSQVLLPTNTKFTPPLATKTPVLPSTLIIPSAAANHPYISAVVTTHGSTESSTLSNTIMSQSPNIAVPDTPNCLPDVSRTTTSQTFTSKQDFVKTWLLSHYQDATQCTVPLYVMYKQLQVAVQNYFKDSEMVTAEEFHRLVRILFPQVQLVQLNTAAGNVEIHYYNLKVVQKPSALDTLLESHPSKCKPFTPASIENCCPVTNVPLTNSAQVNYVVAPFKTDNAHNDQKQLKRHATPMLNGHSTETDNLNPCVNKKPRLESEVPEEFPKTYKHQIAVMTTNVKEVPYVNGMVTQNQHNKLLSQLDERHHQSITNIHINQIPNGSVGEELKHSDSETRAFSSSTVSPLHCESLVNGTDGSSEGTMDSEIGNRVAANIPVPGTVSTVVSNSPPKHGASTISQSAPVNTWDTSPNKRCPKKNNFNHKGKQRGSSSQRPHNLSYLYICEWDNCLQSFDKPQKVYGHVYTNHFMTLRTEVESMCFWAGCDDTTQRTPLPLLNHVNEQHCNNIALESARQIRLAKEKDTSTLNPSVNDIVNTESESTPKLLNFCSSQLVTSVSTPPQASVAPVTLLPTCAPTCDPHQPIIPPVSISTPPAVSLPSEESNSNGVSSSLQPPLVTPTTIISTPVIQESVPSITISNQIEEPAVHETIQCKSPKQEAPPITTVCNTIYTVPELASTSQCPDTSNQSVPLVKTIIKEGPVTKHIRFLSALILRNLCQCSSEARRFVAARHQQIFEMSISGCESSRVLSECLFYSSIENTGSPQKQK